MNQEELKASMEALLSTIKCPVCLVLLDKDLVTCVQGHATCKKCLVNQKSCPTCRQSFSNVQQNTIFTQILETVPHRCRFDKCEKLVRAGEDHEVFCRFRTTKCEYPGCEWLGSLINLDFHVENKKHRKETAVSGMKYLVKVSQHHVNSEGTLLFSAGDHFFWHKIINSYAKNFRFVPLWVGKPTKDLYIRLWFQAGDKEYDVGMKLKTNQSNCAADFFISDSVLSSFYEGNELKYHVFITEERKDAINVLLQ